MNDLIKLTEEFLADSNCDAVAVGVLDFNKNNFKFFEVLDQDVNLKKSRIYFDYASLTKPLTNSFVSISENITDSDLLLLLNHRSGIPAWGLLPKSNWKEQILNYEISESKTEYSDFSALRFMLEIEKKTNKNFKDLVFDNLSDGIIHWRDLEGTEKFVQNGFYNYKPNLGKVHDPNAYNCEGFMSHSGLFGTVEGLGHTLINFNNKFNLLDMINHGLFSNKNRFFQGFDTVSDLNTTLAGKGCSKNTFGHLGFTGTSFWIDPERGLGHIILTNSTKLFWFDKVALNSFRRKLGAIVWEKF
jgi:hypothetical protein